MKLRYEIDLAESFKRGLNVPEQVRRAMKHRGTGDTERSKTQRAAAVHKWGMIGLSGWMGLILCSAMAVEGATVVFSLEDFRMVREAGVKVRMTPGTALQVDGTNVVSGRSYQGETDGNGVLVVSNVLAGNYNVSLDIGSARQTFAIAITNQAGTFIAAEHTGVPTNGWNSASAGYSQAQANGKFATKVELNTTSNELRALIDTGGGSSNGLSALAITNVAFMASATASNMARISSNVLALELSSVQAGASNNVRQATNSLAGTNFVNAAVAEAEARAGILARSLRTNRVWRIADGEGHTLTTNDDLVIIGDGGITQFLPPASQMPGQRFEFWVDAPTVGYAQMATLFTDSVIYDSDGARTLLDVWHGDALRVQSDGGTNWFITGWRSTNGVVGGGSTDWVRVTNAAQSVSTVTSNGVAALAADYATIAEAAAVATAQAYTLARVHESTNFTTASVAAALAAGSGITNASVNAGSPMSATVANRVLNLELAEADGEQPGYVSVEAYNRWDGKMDRTNAAPIRVGTNGTWLLTIGTNTVLTNVISGGWVVVTPDGKIGQGRIPAPYSGIHSVSKVVADAGLYVGDSYYMGWPARALFHAPASGVIAAVNASGNNLVRFLLGTNSVAGTNFAAMTLTNKPAGGTPEFAFTGQDGTTKANIWARDVNVEGNLNSGGPFNTPVLNTDVLTVSNGVSFATRTNAPAGTNYFIDPKFASQAIVLASATGQSLIGATNCNHGGTNQTVLLGIYNNTATNQFWALRTNAVIVSRGQVCGPFTNGPGSFTLVTLCMGPRGTNLVAVVTEF